MVVSQAEGEGWIRTHAAELDDEFADALKNRAEALRQANDTFGAAEFTEYGKLARSLVTLNRLFRVNVQSVEQGTATLESNKKRFDAPLIELLEKRACSRVDVMQSALQGLKDHDPGAVDIARSATEEAQFETGFLWIVAGYSEEPTAKARAALMQGTFLLIRAQLEEFRGEDSAATRSESRSWLTKCADDDAASPRLRAMAEGNLAAVAGEAHLDLVAKHQARAQEFAEAGGDIDQSRQIRRDRAFWAEKSNDWPAALDLYRRNIDDAERKLWSIRSPAEAKELVDSTWYDYQQAVSLSLKLAKDDPAFYQRALEFADQGKARSFLRSLMSLGSGYSRPVPDRLLRRLGRIEERLRGLGDLQKKYSTDVAERHQPEMKFLIDAQGETESQIQSLATTVAIDNQCVPLTFEQMVALVPQGGAIVSYFSLPDRMLIFVLTENGLAGPPGEFPITPRDLAEGVVTAIAMVMLREKGDTLKGLRDIGIPELFQIFLPINKFAGLYKVLIEPVARQIEGLSPLIIVPHPPLQGLPFHALEDGKDGNVIDHAAIAYAPSIAIFRHCREHHRAEATTCFAAGVDESKGGPKGAVGEARVVARFFGSEPSPATRAAVLEQAGAYDVVHLACHGDSASAITSFQGLQLEDGTLYQHEIAGINCHASLVVMSACETAQGDIAAHGEMAGLTGAFLRAGTPSVIASFWKLDDGVAEPMMTEFYAALKQPATNKAEALRRAQVAMKSNGAHPYFWAPLALWGDI